MWVKSGDIIKKVYSDNFLPNTVINLNLNNKNIKILFTVMESNFDDVNLGLEYGGDLVINKDNSFYVQSKNNNQILKYVVFEYV